MYVVSELMRLQTGCYFLMLAHVMVAMRPTIFVLHMEYELTNIFITLCYLSLLIELKNISSDLYDCWFFLVTFLFPKMVSFTQNDRSVCFIPVTLLHIYLEIHSDYKNINVEQLFIEMMRLSTIRHI